jgi:ribosomal protein L37E
MRDERVLKKVTEQTAIATKIAEENKRLRAEEKMQKGRGPKEPYDPAGPNICPECGKNTWDLMTLGTCDACGMWKALWEEKKEKDNGKKKEDSKEPYDPGPRICPECKRNTWDLLTLGTCDACGMRKASRDSFKKARAQRDNYYNDQSSDEENRKAPQAETKAKATAKTKAAAGAGRPHRFDNKQQQTAYSSSSSSWRQAAASSA